MAGIISAAVYWTPDAASLIRSCTQLNTGRQRAFKCPSRNWCPTDFYPGNYRPEDRGVKASANVRAHQGNRKATLSGREDHLQKNTISCTLRGGTSHEKPRKQERPFRFSWPETFRFTLSVTQAATDAFGGSLGFIRKQSPSRQLISEAPFLSPENNQLQIFVVIFTPRP